MKGIHSNISGLNSTSTIDRSTIAQPNAGGEKAGPAFLEQLQALQNAANSVAPTSPRAGSIASANAAAANMALKFSNHAIDRMRARGISFSPDQMAKIQSAVEKAAGKGAKDTLLLTDESALIVSVRDKTVVTVMDKASLKENVFTNIDSTVMI